MTAVIPPAGPSAFAWWRRLALAIITAYLAGFIAETFFGNWDLRRVGWGASFVPVLVEGAVLSFILRGVWGVVLTPLPLLIVPETWIRVGRLWGPVGPAGFLVLAQPVPAMWVAAVIGAAIRRFAPWLARR